jgi:lectin-like protein
MGRAADRRGPGRFSSRCVVLLGCVAGLAACVPERPLSSYREPGEAGADVSSARNRSLPDAGAVDTSESREPPDASPIIDAAPPLVGLMCRDECVCESSVVGAFMFCTTAVSHDDAVDACALAGGGLASVDDPVRNEWLTARMTALAADDFWLSGTDLDDEGVWRWSDGRVFFDVSADASAPAPYAPWDEGQPNDLNGEDCMRSTGGVWRDLDCSGPIAFVCQG